MIPPDDRQIADNVSCDLIVYWLVTAPSICSADV
jgi:hypothetical protein